ncbi:MAG: Gfo/Idh/MocA family oxidoreductase [Rickettsia endosymbiont of Bryobia graminum]|nr:Gfo/Idh/MocA family oxidoreductase [Rickettsia endosymbiont of Bryobia graminum]
MSIGVIGCGYWGSNHIKTLSSLGLLSAVADENPLKAKNLAEMYNAQALTVKEMLENSDIKGIVIASSAEIHYKIATQAIEAGKNLLVEKPIALSSTEAQKLCNLATTKKLVFMVGHLLNFHPAYKKVKELVSNGEVGKIHSIKARRMSMGQIRKEENIMWSFAPHDIALILGISNSLPKITSAYGKKIVSPIEDEYFVTFDLENNIKAEINVSWFHPYKEHKFFVIGEQGSIVFDDSLSWENKVTLYRHEISPALKKGEIITIPVEEKYPLTEELSYFHNCIINQTLPTISTGQQGMDVVKIIEEIEKYAK